MKAWLAIVLGLAVLAGPASALAWSPLRKENPDVRKGNALLREGKPDLALQAYDRAARVLPDAPGVQLNRGLALMGQQDTEAAKEAFLSAASPSSTPDLRADAYYDLGVLFAKTGQALAEQGAQAQQGEPDEQGQHAQAAAQFREAVDAFKRSLRARPGDPNAAWNLEYAKQRLKEQEEEQKKQEQQQQDQPPDENQDQQGQDQQQDDQQDQRPQDQDESSQNQDQKETQEQNDQAQQEAQNEKQEQQQPPAQPQPSEQREQPPTPEHVQRFLDALEHNEESLPLQRARQRSAGRRPPEKDW